VHLKPNPTEERENTDATECRASPSYSRSDSMSRGAGPIYIIDMFRGIMNVDRASIAACRAIGRISNFSDERVGHGQ
jgi:hypothetical protein